MYVDQDSIASSSTITPASCQANRLDISWSVAAGVVVSKSIVG